MTFPKVGSSCVIHANVSPAASHSSETGVGPTPNSNTNCSRPLAIVPSIAKANVLPIVGCPAIGSSVPGVKIRIFTSPGPSLGKMNVDSEKFISFAIVCIVLVSRFPGSGKTASWLPSNARLVKTSRWRYLSRFMACTGFRGSGGSGGSGGRVQWVQGVHWVRFSKSVACVCAGYQEIETNQAPISAWPL